MLSDGTIKKLLRQKRIVIEPTPNDSSIQPASVDLKLDSKFAIMSSHEYPYIDPAAGTKHQTGVVETEEFFLHPNEFVLANTLEWVEIPRDIVAQVDGKSSLGRMGLLVHATAGFIDPGFKGRITLELSNVATLPIRLTYQMFIAQLTFLYLDKPAERPYGSKGLGSKYQGQREVSAALPKREE